MVGVGGLKEESKKLQSQNKSIELDEIRERQEHAIFAPLRIARGEPTEVNQLKHALISGIDAAIEKVNSNEQALNALKNARDIISRIT